MKKFMNYKFNCLYAFKRSSLLLHSYAFNPYAVKFYSDSMKRRGGEDCYQFKLPLYDLNDQFIVDQIKRHNLDPFNFFSDIHQQDSDFVNVKWRSLNDSKKRSILKEIYGLRNYSFAKEVNLHDIHLNFDDFNYDILVKQIKLFLDRLEPNSVYKCLLVGIDDNHEISMGKKSWFVTKNTDPDFVVNNFKLFSNALLNGYGNTKNFVNWTLAYKKWVLHNSIRGDAYKAVGELIDSLNVKTLKKQVTNRIKVNKINDSSNSIVKSSVLNGFRIYDFIHISKYGVLDSTQDGVNVYLCNNFILNVTSIDSNSWKVVLKYKKSASITISWIDSYINHKEGSWRRSFYDYGIVCYYIGDEYSHYESLFKVDTWQPAEKDYEFNSSFGMLDIETFAIKDGDNHGLSIPYCCGYRDYKGKIQTFYLENGEDPFNVVVRMIQALFTTAKYHNHIFYVHNLSGFDSRFILEALGLLDYSYEAKAWGKSMREIYKIQIKKKIGTKRVCVTLVDSYYILSLSLDTLGHKFVVDSKKGYFPYEFVDKNKLFYEGEVPEYKYYAQKLNAREYMEMKSRYSERNLWSTKNETEKYLIQDLECLYQVMYKFNRGIFKDFSVNVTNVTSYSSLSKLVYLSNFYGGVEIPVITGHIESEIRKAYYGGIVDINQHIVSSAFKYDSNSHYPAAMLNDMPVGNPIVTDLKELDKIFGYCYVTVTAPSSEELATAILPSHDEFGNVYCPRGVFSGVYFSEELKDARRYGYKIEVHSAIMFRRGKGVFDKFITELFKRKADAKVRQDGVYELIYKLLQNSLYGKSGEREIVEQFNIIKSDEVEKLELKKDIHQMHEFGNRTLVRTSEYNDELKELIKLIIDKQGESKSDVEFLEKGEKISLRVPPRKKSSVKSSVCIAAAITSYARISMNKYKNIPSNKYLGGDTDSAIMQQPLDPQYVGPALGLMKLEYVINRGLQADKKLYYIEDSKGNRIIKSRGVGRDLAGKDLLNYDDFIKIFSGEKLTVKKTKFMIKDDGVYIKDQDISVQIKPSVNHTIRSEIRYILSRGPLNDPVRYSLALKIISKYAEVMEAKKKYSIVPYDLFPKVPMVYKPCCCCLALVYNNKINNYYRISFNAARLVRKLVYNKHQYHTLSRNLGRRFIHSLMDDLNKDGIYNDNNLKKYKVLTPFYLEGNILPPLHITKTLLYSLDKSEDCLSKLPCNSLVKRFILNRLQDKFKLTAKLGTDSTNILNSVRLKDPYIKKKIFFGQGDFDYYTDVSFTAIDFSYYRSNIFRLRKIYRCLSGKFEDDSLIFREKVKAQSLFDDSLCGCYIIYSKKSLYYYIGYSMDIRKRLNSHYNKIKNFNSRGSGDLFNFYIDSCIENKVKIDFEMGPICLYKNYFKAFLQEYPYYKLSVGEYLILTFYTDLIGKILEQSLISYYNPLLNSLKNVSVKNIVWDDKYLVTPYTPNYKHKNIKYQINWEDGGSLSLKSELYLVQKFNLDINEVLANLGKLHYYKNCEWLRQPIIINKVEE